MAIVEHKYSYSLVYANIASGSGEGIKRTVTERGHISDAATSTPEPAIRHSSKVIVEPFLQEASE